MTEPSLTGHMASFRTRHCCLSPDRVTGVMGAWGVLRGELGSPLPPQSRHVSQSQPEMFLTHLSAFARAILSAQPALPYLRPPPSDNVTHILQGSAPGARPLGPLLQYAGTEEPRPSPCCPHVLPHTFPTTAVMENDGYLFRGSCPLPQTVSS